MHRTFSNEHQLLNDHELPDAEDGAQVPDIHQPLSWYLLLVVILSGVGGLMFGYDTGVVAGVLVLIGDDLGKLSVTQKEVISSITCLGALGGSLSAGFLADGYGRRTVIGWSCIAFVVSAMIMAGAGSYIVLVTGRLLVGVAVGAASTVVPMYIAEVSPAHYRGRLVTINSLCTTGGQVVAYATGIAFANVSGGWRYVLGLSGIPPLIFLLSMAAVPESPRYLFLKERVADAEIVLRRLHGESYQAYMDSMLCGSKNSENPTIRQTLKQLFTVRSNLRALIVACGLMACQQLCGFNAFMYYSATMFASVGFSDPIAVSMVVALTNFIFTWVSLRYIDSVGRRKLLLGTMWLMIVALVVTAIRFNSGGLMIVLSIIVYVAAYAAALGNVPWQATEFLPLPVRSLGSMMVSATNWSCNFLVSASFLSLLELITPRGTFLLFALITLIFYVCIYLFYPEAAGLSLEEIEAIFETDSWFVIGKKYNPIPASLN